MTEKAEINFHKWFGWVKLQWSPYLGKMSFYLDETLIGEINLIAGQTVCSDRFKPRTVWERLRESLN